ncbi:hypothetical protein FACS1894166_06910 [Bacilli bacterium]|nr:hypothetical protein FACS1894166_06910 [Bacilli bacterium]
MNITKQANPNECGVCVINSLVQHYYHIERKISILNDANMSTDGLSIFDFEVLAQKYGIFAESYQLTANEFHLLKNSSYIVCLIHKNESLHYVIVKKHQRYLEVFDSDKGRYEIKDEEFGKVFAGIIILISKHKVKNNFYVKKPIDYFKSIDLKYLFLNLFMQVVIIALSTVSANFLNTMINNAIAVSSFSNAIVIAVIFLLIYLMNGLSKYILHLYASKHFKINFQYLSNSLINALKYKKHSFLIKIDPNYFYVIDNAMQSITNFLINEITMLFANMLLLIMICILIICINP